MQTNMSPLIDLDMLEQFTKPQSNGAVLQIFIVLINASLCLRDLEATAFFKILRNSKSSSLTLSANGIIVLLNSVRLYTRKL